MLSNERFEGKGKRTKAQFPAGFEPSQFRSVGQSSAACATSQFRLKFTSAVVSLPTTIVFLGTRANESLIVH